MAYYSKLASAIYNDLIGGLRGYTSSINLSMEQLEDDIVDERLQLIKEYSLKGLIPKKDLLMSINCIPIDCKDITNCTCKNTANPIPTMHFEIPLILTEFGGGIEYIGSVDKTLPFTYYTSMNLAKAHKYRKRLAHKPYIYIDTTPNSNNMNDCWVYNAPLLKKVSVIGVFKDPRQLEAYGCCGNEDLNNMTFLDAEIKKRVTEKKLRYYRQAAPPVLPNDQVPK